MFDGTIHNSENINGALNLSILSKNCAIKFWRDLNLAVYMRRMHNEGANGSITLADSVSAIYFTIAKSPKCS